MTAELDFTTTLSYNVGFSGILFSPLTQRVLENESLHKNFYISREPRCYKESPKTVAQLDK